MVTSARTSVSTSTVAGVVLEPIVRVCPAKAGCSIYASTIFVLSCYLVIPTSYQPHMTEYTSHGAPISIPRLGQNGSGNPTSKFSNDHIMQSDGAQKTLLALAERSWISAAKSLAKHFFSRSSATSSSSTKSKRLQRKTGLSVNCLHKCLSVVFISPYDIYSKRMSSGDYYKNPASHY